MIVFGTIWFSAGGLLLAALIHSDRGDWGSLTRDQRRFRAFLGLVAAVGLRLVYTGLTPRVREDDFDDPEYPEMYRPD